MPCTGIVLALIHVGLTIDLYTQPASDIGAVWALAIFGVIIFLLGGRSDT